MLKLLLEKKFDLALANSEHLAPLRTEFKELLTKAGFGEKAVDDVILAVNEALTNMIRHSYEGKGGRVKMVFQDYPECVVIEIQDFGKKFDPSKIAKPKLPPDKPGGLGLYLIKSLMDKVEYDMNFEPGNLVRLTKYKSKGEKL